MTTAIESIKLKFRNIINSREVKTLAYEWGIQTINFPMVTPIYNFFYNRQISRKIRNLPKTLVIEPYNLCNLSCIMCPYPDMTREKEQMSMDLFKKIIDDAVANNFESLSLSLYNEPYLDSMFFERIKYAKQKGLYVFVATNGFSLTQERIEKTLESGLDCVTFSIDSLDKEKYEKIRVNAKFEKTIDNVKKLLKYRNEKKSATPLITMSAIEQGGKDPSLDHMSEILQGLDLYVVSKLDNRRNGDSNYKRFGLRYPCWWIWHQLVVYSNGKIALCCMDYDDEFALGDLNHQTIAEVWSSDKFERLRNLHLNREFDKIAMCKDCDIPYRQSPFFWWSL